MASVAGSGESPSGSGPGDGQERVVIPSSVLAGRGAPSRVLLVPWGEVRSANGAFLLDGESGRLVLESFAAQGTDLPIDYEHQSLGGTYSSPTGQAPAAGWVRSLSVVHPEDANEAAAGLYADVTWTPGGREKLEAMEYRYLSPVVLVRKHDRRVVALHSAALTNKPAIAGMRPIVNRQEAGEMAAEGGSGVAEAAPETGEVPAVAALRARLGLGEEADAELVLVSAAARLDSLMAAAADREAQERVEAAIRAGKLTVPQRAWALSLAQRDPASFDAWAASAPAVMVPGRTSAPADGQGRGERARAAAIASARAAYRSEPSLALLTDEEAWIGDALREAGLGRQEM